MTQSIEKSFLIDPLNTNNAIYRDSLTLVISTDLLNHIKKLRFKFLKFIHSIFWQNSENKNSDNIRMVVALSTNMCLRRSFNWFNNCPRDFVKIIMLYISLKLHKWVSNCRSGFDWLIQSFWYHAVQSIDGKVYEYFFCHSYSSLKNRKENVQINNLKSHWL